MYNESRLAREAKAMLKHHLALPDGAAQRQVDMLDELQLLELVAANDYPPQDRPQVIQGALDRFAAEETASIDPGELEPFGFAEDETDVEPVDVELVDDETDAEPVD